MDEIKCNPEKCDLQMKTINNRLDKIEEREEHRTRELNIIGKAMVEIQAFTKVTSETLSKLESRIETYIEENTKHSNAKMLTIFDKIITVLAAIIGALLGVNLF